MFPCPKALVVLREARHTPPPKKGVNDFTDSTGVFGQEARARQEGRWGGPSARRPLPEPCVQCRERPLDGAGESACRRLQEVGEQLEESREPSSRGKWADGARGRTRAALPATSHSTPAPGTRPVATWEPGGPEGTEPGFLHGPSSAGIGNRSPSGVQVSLVLPSWFPELLGCG